MRFPGSGLFKRSGRIKIFGFSVVMVFAVLLAVNAAGASVNPGGLCTSCHEMKPALSSIQASSHSRVDCTTCHVENVGVEAVRMARRIVSHFGGPNATPIKLFTRIPNEECLACHTLKKVSPSSDIKINHDIHINSLKLTCVQCHNRAAHPGQTDFSDGSRMTACLQCHDGKIAPKECNACHSTDRNRPAEHNNNWWRRHGQEAYKDTSSCKGCHGWTENFCKECHKSGRPPSHDQTWAFMHAERARESAGGCTVCHEQQSFCNRCHEVRHPSNWLDVHWQTAKTGAASCYKCHQNLYCASCHTRSLPRNRS